MKNEEAVKWLEAIRRKYIHGGDEGYDQKRNEALDLAIAALERDRWISVEERLPENGKYLVCRSSFTGGYYNEVLTYTRDLENFDKFDFKGKRRPGWIDYDGEYGYFEADNVTHWMLLPEPPKEET